MLRRDFLLSALAATSLPTVAQSLRTARLVIVGGAEDRLQDRVILRKFIEYSGGPKARLRLITAASGVPEAVAESYARAFGELGAQDFAVLPLHDRESAFSTQLRDDILQADGIFMSGGGSVPADGRHLGDAGAGGFAPGFSLQRDLHWWHQCRGGGHVAPHDCAGASPVAPAQGCH